ncbi:hypothetical protein VUR80DRAFT_2108 [Thermomyces stellatus]
MAYRLFQDVIWAAAVPHHTRWIARLVKLVTKALPASARPGVRPPEPDATADALTILKAVCRVSRDAARCIWEAFGAEIAAVRSFTRLDAEPLPACPHQLGHRPRGAGARLVRARGPECRRHAPALDPARYPASPHPSTGLLLHLVFDVSPLFTCLPVLLQAYKLRVTYAIVSHESLKAAQQHPHAFRKLRPSRRW